jgi:hypothetical protein
MFAHVVESRSSRFQWRLHRIAAAAAAAAALGVPTTTIPGAASYTNEWGNPLCEGRRTRRSAVPRAGRVLRPAWPAGARGLRWLHKVSPPSNVYHSRCPSLFACNRESHNAFRGPRRPAPIAFSRLSFPRSLKLTMTTRRGVECRASTPTNLALLQFDIGSD